MQDFEKLGAFYLGRPRDVETGKPGSGLILYDARDLVTHAVCVGMTGSGKTGLGLALVEEAAIDGIPAIVIDPKGDLANLLLLFPELRAEDFRPWINEDDARAQGVAPEKYAEAQAALWRDGLAAWGQDGERIRRLRDAAEYAVYTPGSGAGRPVSILDSFAAPPEELRADDEALRDRIGATTASLLALMGIEADPIRSREHILIATLLDAAWRAGRNVDLAALIAEIQSPPVRRIGVLDVETFFPAKERFELAMALNNLLAAPGFSRWLEGEPLDPGRFLHAESGKPRVSIFSIAHLSDGERMFFVSLLLNQIVGWMRTQPGTSSLRAVVYMDEIFGYFPPTANPPSKQPLLTLLKQARAFGIGLVLGTQNPVDLDYKGLGNTGTWFIGRLQTERDKARLLDGLEGAAGAAFDRGRLEGTLSRLGKRVFLMHNVHDDAPAVFETRWCLCYLRGPLTREQIRRLTPRGEAAPAPAPASAAVPPAAASPRAARSAAAVSASARPVLPPAVPQLFVPVRGTPPQGSRLVYEPRVLGAAQVRFVDTRTRVDAARDVALLAPIAAGPVAVDWGTGTAADLAPGDLGEAPEGKADYQDPGAAAADPKSYAAWKRDLGAWLFANAKLELWRSPSLGEIARVGEPERHFRIRLQQRAREQRDVEAEALRARYAPKMAALEERLRRVRQAEQREGQQASDQRIQTAISVGAALLDAFVGRKLFKASTLGRASTAARGVGRSLKEAGDVARAGENVAAVEAQIAELAEQLRAETESLQARIDPLAEPLEAVVLRPKKTHVTVQFVALAWTPSWVDARGAAVPAWAPPGA